MKLTSSRAYETALKTECDYKGYQPYWNWGKYSDLTVSPIFNGDDWSMGGNGEAVKHAGGFIGRQVPAGPGGGCVKTGPFAGYVTGCFKPWVYIADSYTA
jgi:tyrosinase